MSKRIELTVTSTRPDLEVSIQMPGAYIVKDGKQIPDLNDEAMKEREARSKKQEEKSSNVSPLTSSDEKKDEADQ